MLYLYNRMHLLAMKYIFICGSSDELCTDRFDRPYSVPLRSGTDNATIEKAKDANVMNKTDLIASLATAILK